MYVHASTEVFIIEWVLPTAWMLFSVSPVLMMLLCSELFIQAHLVSLFLGSYPKTKPPPLLSLHRPPGLSLGAPPVRGPLPSSHSPYGGPPSRGPLLPHPGPRGPHGIRGAPPSLKSSRPPLLSAPGASYFPHCFLQNLFSVLLYVYKIASGYS